MFWCKIFEKSIQKWLVRSDDSLDELSKTDYYLTKCLYHTSFDNHAGFRLPSPSELNGCSLMVVLDIRSYM